MSKKVSTTTEILAPAGSIEQLIAAVNNGCDAVYLGLDEFNARMKAPNFTYDNIRYWIDYCHSFGVKVFVAINTSIKNDEYVYAVKMLNHVYKNNADGVILTDLALIKLASQLPKPFEIVASTQLNAHDEYGAKFLQKCGATTVVCARESSLDEIKSVVNSGVKAECFIHGATCVCQSGQCLLSSLSGGNSGNRGLCAQPCRKLYSADNGDNFAYLLSARDLCGLDIAKKLVESGVSTFKIEGRNRRAEYAGICSETYKNLLTDIDYSRGDAYVALAEMFNRNMGELSYLNGKNDNIIYSACQNHTGVTVGKVKGCGVVGKVALSKGDGLKVFNSNKEICGSYALESGVGYVPCAFSDKVSDGMIVNRTTSVELCDKVSGAKRLIPIKVKFYAHVNQYAKIIAETYDGTRAEIISAYIVPEYQNRPLDEFEIRKQLQKTGDTQYTICDIIIDIDNVFLAKSQINALRRDVLNKLTENIIAKYDSKYANRNNSEITMTSPIAKPMEINCAVICNTIKEMREVDERVEYIILKTQIIDESLLRSLNGVSCFVDIPSFSDNFYLEKLFSKYRIGIVCHNVGHVELARKLNLPYIAGSGLNIFNDYILNEFEDAETFVYSLELTLNEISQFADRSGLIFVDGKLPLMKFVHCPYKVVYNCNCSSCKSSNNLIYTDALGNSFSVFRRKDGRCTFELINGRKLSVVNKIKKAGRYLMDYNSNVVAHYLALNNGFYDEYVEKKPYTKGRLYDKVN